MEIKAYLRYLRIAPRKVRLVADSVKGKTIRKAEAALRFSTRRPATHIRKLLNSAVSNAKHNFNKDKDKLFIKDIRVDSGPTLKRFMPRARGRSAEIKKRSSHITIMLEEL